MKIKQINFENQKLYHKFKNHLECALCSDFKDDPIACEVCQHSFCNQCLVSFDNCPNCRNSKGFFADNKVRDLANYLELKIRCDVCFQQFQVKEYKFHLYNCFRLERKKFDELDIQTRGTKIGSLFFKWQRSDNLFSRNEFTCINDQAELLIAQKDKIHIIMKMAVSFYALQECVVDNVKLSKASLNKALFLEPFNYFALNRFGLILQDEGDIEESQNYFKKASANKLKQVSQIKEHGRIMENIDIERSQLQQNQAQEIENDPSILINMGLIMIHNEKYDIAIKYFEDSLLIDPNIAESYQNLGIIQQKKKDQNKHQKYIMKAFQISHNYADAMFQLSLQYQKRNEFTKCKELLDNIQNFNTRHRESTHFECKFENRFEEGFEEYIDIEEQMHASSTSQDNSENLKILLENESNKIEKIRQIQDESLRKKKFHEYYHNSENQIDQEGKILNITKSDMKIKKYNIDLITYYQL